MRTLDKDTEFSPTPLDHRFLEFHPSSVTMQIFVVFLSFVGHIRLNGDLRLNLYFFFRLNLKYTYICTYL